MAKSKKSDYDYDDPEEEQPVEEHEPTEAEKAAAKQKEEEEAVEKRQKREREQRRDPAIMLVVVRDFIHKRDHEGSVDACNREPCVMIREAAKEEDDGK